VVNKLGRARMSFVDNTIDLPYSDFLKSSVWDIVNAEGSALIFGYRNFPKHSIGYVEGSLYMPKPARSVQSFPHIVGL